MLLSGISNRLNGIIRNFKDFPVLGLPDFDFLLFNSYFLICRLKNVHAYTHTSISPG